MEIQPFEIPKSPVIDDQEQNTVPLSRLQNAPSVYSSYPNLPIANSGPDVVGEWMEESNHLI